MKKVLSTCMASLLALSFSASVLAEDKTGFHGAIGATTDLVFDGVSLSDEGPAVGGNAHYYSEKYGTYAGISAVTGDSDGVVDDYLASLFVGSKFALLGETDSMVYVEAEFYTLETNRGMLYDDFYDIKLGIDQVVDDAVNVGAEVSYADDYFDVAGEAVIVSIYGEYTDLDIMPDYSIDDITVGVTGGRNNNDVDDYGFWEVYMMKQLDNGIGAKLAYHNANTFEVFADEFTDDRVVATLWYRM